MFFAIRYRIDQAIKLQDISKIVVITDAILATKQIFNTSVYLYQLHFITISKNLRKFFKRILTTQYLSEIILIASNGLYIQESTKN